MPAHACDTSMKALVQRIADRIHRPAGFDGRANGGLLPSSSYRLPLPLDPDWDAGWKMYPQFKGPTRNLLDLSCHASVLVPGHCPHEPHAHDEEEILLILAGEAELILPQGGQAVDNGRLHARAGAFVYYPGNYPHTLRALGTRPLEYLMFKWTARIKAPSDPLGFIPLQIAWPEAPSPGQGGYRGLGLFEGPTRQLRKLHCHSSRVEPGGGYPVHVDDHDVAIVMLEGECEIRHQKIGAGTVVFSAAGDLHGMHNPSDRVARYLVFEFHGDYRPSLLERIGRRIRTA